LGIAHGDGQNHGALIAAIVVALALLEWVAMRHQLVSASAPGQNTDLTE
jgi:hypothetical protein